MKTIDKTTGTSFHGVTVTASVNQLKQILGEPTIVDNNGEYKVNYEWCIANYNGEPASIYDWKYYRPLTDDEMVDWHIGAHSHQTSAETAYQLEELLS